MLETVRREIQVPSRRVQRVAQKGRDARLLMTVPSMGYHTAILMKAKSGMSSVFYRRDKYAPMLDFHHRPTPQEYLP